MDECTHRYITGDGRGGAQCVACRAAVPMPELHGIVLDPPQDDHRVECEAVRSVLEPVFFDGLGAVWGATTDEIVACVRGLIERSGDKPRWARSEAEILAPARPGERPQGYERWTEQCTGAPVEPGEGSPTALGCERMTAIDGARIRVAADPSIAPNIAVIIDADDHGAAAWATLSPSDRSALARLLGATPAPATPEGGRACPGFDGTLEAAAHQEWLARTGDLPENCPQCRRRVNAPVCVMRCRVHQLCDDCGADLDAAAPATREGRAEEGCRDMLDAVEQLEAIEASDAVFDAVKNGQRARAVREFLLAAHPSAAPAPVRAPCEVPGCVLVEPHKGHADAHGRRVWTPPYLDSAAPVRELDAELSRLVERVLSATGHDVTLELQREVERLRAALVELRTRIFGGDGTIGSPRADWARFIDAALSGTNGGVP